jgi:hypothetical protein
MYFACKKITALIVVIIVPRFIMPKVLNWIFIHTYDNETGLELFLQTLVQTSTGKLHLATGTICLESEKLFEVQNFLKPTKSCKDACNDFVVSSCKELSEGRYCLKLKRHLEHIKYAYVLNVPMLQLYIFLRPCAIFKHLLYFLKTHNVSVPGTKFKKTFNIKTRIGRPKSTQRAQTRD